MLGNSQLERGERIAASRPASPPPATDCPATTRLARREGRIRSSGRGRGPLVTLAVSADGGGAMYRSPSVLRQPEAAHHRHRECPHEPAILRRRKPPSALDPCLFSFFPRRMFFMAKRELSTHRFTRWLVRGRNAFPAVGALSCSSTERSPTRAAWAAQSRASASS
jgi:hypothetical protein